jgi:preprotein translocase subunit SecF
LEIFRRETHINFLGPRKVAFTISALLIAVSLASLVVRGLNFGIEFRGGAVLEAGFPETVDLGPVRQQLEAAGFERAQVQHFGSSREITVQILPKGGSDEDEAAVQGQIRDDIMAVLRQVNPEVELRRVEFVGPQVGQELAEQGGMATLFALLMILAYVAFRFQWKFSLGAVAALVHDVIIVLGFFSLSWMAFDLAVLAAILAVIGYSLNDTIVVFDRIRENMLRMRRRSAEEVINVSLNQTLSRTIMTGVTTLIVLVALWLLGGEAIAGFSVALIIGILIGTYSSVYIASAVALWLKVVPADLLPPQKDESKVDVLP